jgi:hypothetical protein
MQTKLAGLLLAHAPLAALVGNRIHWRRMPQGQPMPNIVMHKISGVHDYTMSGASGYVATRVQFNCKGHTVAEAQSVALALEARLSGFSGVYGGFNFQGCFLVNEGQDDGKDGVIDWYIERRDFSLHWAPA